LGRRIGALSALAAVVGLAAGLGFAMGTLAVLSFVLPADASFGATYLAVGAPLVGGVVVSVVVFRRSRSPLLRGGAAGFAAACVLMLMLFAGAG